jgi:iron complex outermembrane receptor protein
MRAFFVTRRIRPDCSGGKGDTSMKKPVVLFIAASLLAAGPAPAELINMDQVVVTATRQAEELASVPAGVTVISEAEIARSAAGTLPELLRNVEGVVVNDINGSGRFFTVDLRGFGETASLNTLVMIDGRRINQADLSGVDWTLIPLDRVERIEIVRGSRGSVLYGDNATGGVINIITKQGTKEWLAKTALSGGSYGTYQGNAAVRGTADKLSLAVNGNYRAQDGYRDNSDGWAKDFGLGMAYDATDKLSLNLSTGYHQDEARLPGALSSSDLASGIPRTATLHPDDFTDTKDWYVQGGPRIFLNDNSYFDLDIATRKRESEFFSLFDGGHFVGATEIKTLTVSPRLVLNEQLAGHDSKVVLGYDYEKSTEDLRNETVFFGTPSIASFRLSKTNQGYFGHAEVSLTEQLAVSGGYRHDQVDFSFKSKDTGSNVGSDFAENLYTAGVTYRITEHSSVYASYARGFRYPVLDESFNFFDNTVNASLTPQTSDDYEIGLRQEFASGLSVTANLFRMEIDQEIFFNPSSFSNENLDGTAVRQGLELSAGQQFAAVLLTGSYTYRETEIDGGQFDGNDLPNVPKHQLTLGMQTDVCRHVRLNLDSTYVGKRRFVSDFDNSHERQKAYLLVSGKLSYLLDKGSVYLAAKNILDQQYSEYGVINFLGEENFYPSPGVNFLVGADWQF